MSEPENSEPENPAFVKARRLVAAVCAAQVLVQIGAFFWPALLPGMVPLWQLTNSEAGWITAIFYGAYMVSVPVLVTLTDRVDPKRVYLFGVGATVAGHVLFAVLADGFWSALLTRALTGMGWAGTYMTGLKLLSDQVDAKMMSRAVTGHAASIAGNEAAIRFGRRRLITAAMIASIVIGGGIGFAGASSYAVASALLVLYGIVIWLDSSSLTAGAAGTAEPSRRGATLAVHSMLGYAGGFVGPLLIGWILDFSGGMSRNGWGFAFMGIALLMSVALAVFSYIRPKELEGDRGHAAAAGKP